MLVTSLFHHTKPIVITYQNIHKKSICYYARLMLSQWCSGFQPSTQCHRLDWLTICQSTRRKQPRKLLTATLLGVWIAQYSDLAMTCTNQEPKSRSRRDVHLPQHIQTGSGAHPAFHSMCIGVLSPTCSLMKMPHHRPGDYSGGPSINRGNILCNSVTLRFL